MGEDAPPPILPKKCKIALVNCPGKLPWYAYVPQCLKKPYTEQNAKHEARLLTNKRVQEKSTKNVNNSNPNLSYFICSNPAI
jgi:hypothetical protein